VPVGVTERLREPEPERDGDGVDEVLREKVGEPLGDSVAGIDSDAVAAAEAVVDDETHSVGVAQGEADAETLYEGVRDTFVLAEAVDDGEFGTETVSVEVGSGVDETVPDAVDQFAATVGEPETLVESDGLCDGETDIVRVPLELALDEPTALAVHETVAHDDREGESEGESVAFVTGLGEGVILSDPVVLCETESDGDGVCDEETLRVALATVGDGVIEAQPDVDGVTLVDRVELTAPDGVSVTLTDVDALRHALSDGETEAVPLVDCDALVHGVGVPAAARPDDDWLGVVERDGLIVGDAVCEMVVVGVTLSVTLGVRVPVAAPEREAEGGVLGVDVAPASDADRVTETESDALVLAVRLFDRVPDAHAEGDGL